MKDDTSTKKKKLFINRLLISIAGESSASAVTSAAPITRAYTLCILALLLSVIVIGSGQST